MGKVSGSSLRGARLATFVASVALVMCMPVVASAATATLSSIAPKKGSSSADTRPAIKLTVSDAAGVKGSANYSMWVDGVKVKPSIAYTASRYRKFRLTYEPASGLAAGAHTVKVSLKDLKKKKFSYTWSFAVATTEPPATGPPTTEPPATEPSTTAPPAAEPSTTAPPATEPSATEPPVAHIPETPTVVCSTIGCHSDAGTAPLTAPHAKMVAGHAAALSSTCVKSGCHTGDLVILHAAARGCSTCHGPGTTLTKDCGAFGCHVVTSPSHLSHPVSAADEIVRIVGTDFGTHACSECHEPLDLIDVHGGTCASCHPGAASGAPLTGGCVQGSCHTSGALAKHRAIDADHTLAAAPGCIGDDCHPGGTNVAAIHRTQGCATCHVPGKTPTLVCETAGCHDAVASSDPHPEMTAGHTLDLPLTCVKVGCHAPDLPGLHAAKLGCKTCHGPGKTPSKDCQAAGCHPYAVESPVLHPQFCAVHTGQHTGCTVAGCHSTDVIAIHTARPNASGCAACHGASQPVLTLECAADGCHPQRPPAHEMHLVTPASESVTISGTSFGTHACAECHAPLDLISLHDGACTACHANGAPTASLAGGCVQGSCHASGAHAKHGTIDADHTLAAAPSCIGVDCHTGGTNVAEIHRTQGCATCHAPGVTATRACATAGCHGQADPNPASAPHAKMAPGHTTGLSSFCAKAGCHASDLVALHAASSGCATCHGNGKTATKTCTASGCHPGTTGYTSHTGYVTKHVLTSTPSCAGSDCHSAQNDVRWIHQCGACHAAGKPALTLDCSTKGCHSAPDPHPYAAPHPGMAAAHTTGLPSACVTSGCHAGDLRTLHAAKSGCATCHATGKTPSKDCAAAGCHTASGTAMHDAHPSTVTTATFKINNLGMGTHACTECHASTELQAAHGETGARNSCATCHPTAVASAKPWNGSCVQGNCHAGTASNKMHADINTAHTLDYQPGCTRTYPGCHVGNKDIALTHYLAGCKTCHTPDGAKPTKDCISCHPQASTGDHLADHAACNECHSLFEWDQAKSTANKGAQLSPVHWSLQDAKWTVLIGRATIRPGYPFGDYTMLVFPGPIGGPGPYTSKPYVGHTGTYTCTTCHTGAGKTWVHPGSDYFTCGSSGDCHYHHGNWDPAEDSDSYVHNTPPASWRYAMKW